MSRSFAVRGVVEGFYGTPWSHAARLHMLSFLGRHSMNAYVYAPKDDERHRARWRDPYDAAELARFAELATAAREAGVRFGFAISPGLDVDHASATDRAALVAKLRPLVDAGVEWFLLLLDDIPMQPDLAPRQADLSGFLLDALRDEQPAAALTMCPTEYVGTRPSPYLAALGAELPREIGVMWTGPTVCSPTITSDDARSWSAAVGGRAPLLWDNFPVNDATMTASVHLGPYEGRDADLAGVVEGVLCNPMTQAFASQLPLATAAAFLRDPDAYDPEVAWEEAIGEVGGERAPALRVLARACADSPLRAPDALELHRCLDALDACEQSGDRPEARVVVERIADGLRAVRELPEGFPAGGDALAREVAPWAEAARTEAEAGLAATRLLLQVWDPEDRAADPRLEAEHALLHAFGLLFSWTAARTNNQVVFGPRFAIYAAVVQEPDGSMGLDTTLALREDANAIDRLCRFALRAYEAWRHRGAAA